MAFGGGAEGPRQYEEKAGALAPDDLNGHYLLGLWCRKEKLEDQARMEFERVIALEPDHEGARRELGYERTAEGWLSREEAMRAKGLVRHDGAWLLPEEVAILKLPKTEKEKRLSEQARVRDLLSKMAAGGAKVERIATGAFAGIEDRYKVDPLAFALRYPAENVRLFAARELGRIGDRRALRPLVHRTLVDPSEPVRIAALEAAKSFRDPNLLAPYVRAMWSENAAVRVNAVEAVARIEEPLGIEYLVYRLQAHGGGINRSHIYCANQLSFIQDFDVEVAQTAFIADPMVGILQEGQILDVRVLATERDAAILERRVIRQSLVRLAGQDLGEDATAWAKWWAENRERLLAKAQ
jgi:hypothetical protein